MRAGLLSTLLCASLLAGCPAGSSGLVTANSPGDIGGIGEFKLGAPLSGPPAGFHVEPYGSYGNAFVKEEDASIGGSTAKKNTRIFLENGAISSIEVLFKPNSDADSKKIGAAVLASLKKEYGAKLETTQFSGKYEDAQGEVLNFGQGPVEISVIVHKGV